MSSPEIQDQQSRKGLRRFFSFRLRTFILVIALTLVSFGWWQDRTEVHRLRTFLPEIAKAVDTMLTTVGAVLVKPQYPATASRSAIPSYHTAKMLELQSEQLLERAVNLYRERYVPLKKNHRLQKNNSNTEP